MHVDEKKKKYLREVFGEKHAAEIIADIEKGVKEVRQYTAGYKSADGKRTKMLIVPALRHEFWRTKTLDGVQMVEAMLSLAKALEIPPAMVDSLAKRLGNEVVFEALKAAAVDAGYTVEVITEVT